MVLHAYLVPHFVIPQLAKPQPFSVGDRVKNVCDNRTGNTSPRVFIVRGVSGKTYTVQRENTDDAYVTYEEHEIEGV